MKTKDTGRLSKQQRADLQEAFQIQLKKYRQEPTPELWDDLFVRVLDAANHLMSKMAPFRDDRYDIAEEATIRFMTKIRDGVKEGPGRRSANTKLKEWNPRSLITMVRFEIVYLLYNDQQQWEDTCCSLEAWQENISREEELGAVEENAEF